MALPGNLYTPLTHLSEINLAEEKLVEDKLADLICEITSA